MIPRVRPYFHKSYINSVNEFESSIEREQYQNRISQKLDRYYPNAEAFELFDYGRNSLAVGLSILGFQENDEILVPCFTCSTVLESIISKNLKPVLYDIEFDFSVSIDKLERKITSKTKAIIVTHFFGIPSNITEIKEFTDSKGIFLIEDCAHCIGLKIDNIVLGEIGDFSFTSFGNDKPLSIGNGSLLIFNNQEYLSRFYEIIPTIELNDEDSEKCSFLSLLFFYLNTDKSVYHNFIGVYDFYHYLMMNKSQVNSIYQELKKKDLDIPTLTQSLSGFRSHKLVLSPFRKIINYFIRDRSKRKREISQPKRMNCFSMNILNSAIDHVDEVNTFRKRIGSYYIENFLSNDDIIAPTSQTPFLRYSIISKKPQKTAKVVKDLKLGGYECGNFNWGQPLNKFLKTSERFENSEYIAENIINLPCHFDIEENDVSKICEIVKSGYM